MLTRLYKIFNDLRASYWFMPTIMVLAALGILAGLVWVDAQDPLGAIEGLEWLNWGTPEGVRTLLGAIAGSMITVAGVTFSVTIVSVAHASTQLGPRLLTNFMADRGNQVTLGTFIATFLYALLLMRIVDGGAKTAEAAQVAAPFVPHLAVTFAIAMAIASTFNLIYFLHHVPASIHTSNVVATLGRKLQRQVLSAFPEQLGAGDSDPAPYRIERPAEAVNAHAAGYLQFVDLGALQSAATAVNGRIHLAHVAGDFVAEREALAWVVCDGSVSEDVARRVRSSFALSARRTPARDLAFIVDELCEIATRALSPGINDPYTAIGCIDWLLGAFGQLHDRGPAPCVRRDADGVARVVLPEMSFETLVDHAMAQLRPYVASDRNAALHLQRRLGRLLLKCQSVPQRLFVLLHAQQLQAFAEPLLHAADLALIAQRNGELEGFVQAVDLGPMQVLTHAWLAGR